MEYNFQRYLAAKQTVDDRALNRHVWETLRAALPTQPQIVEVGCGVGTMLRRLREWGLIGQDAQYLGVDADPANIQVARQNFSQVAFQTADVYNLPPGAANLLIAHAFLDLFNIPKVLPILFNLLQPGGLYYFTINFDGASIFEPAHPLDEVVLSAYHRSMDQRMTAGELSGDSRAGRHLFAHLKTAGAEIMAAGSSDWVVHAGRTGYPGDEAYFLHHILYFFEQTLTTLPEIDVWLKARRAQIASGELVYIAHQLDFVGRV